MTIRHTNLMHLSAQHENALQNRLSQLLVLGKRSVKELKTSGLFFTEAGKVELVQQSSLLLTHTDEISK
jgi:hypothetical protein